MLHKGPLYQLLLRRAGEGHVNHDKDGTQISSGSSSSLKPAHFVHSSYTILLEHSMSLSQRISASMTSDISMTAKERLIYDRSGIMEPEEMAYRNNCGSTIFDEGNPAKGEDEWCKIFRKNGVIVDLYDDFFGWNEEVDNSHKNGNRSENLTENSSDAESQIRRISCSAKKLSSVVEQVVKQVMKLAELKHGQSNANTTRSIPILVDSVAPFFAFHGERCTLSFLRSLQQHRSIKTENNSTSVATTLSPLIISSMKGSVSLSQHRILEDLSDALVMLMQGEISILRKSRTTGKVSVEKQPVIEGDEKLPQKTVAETSTKQPSSQNSKPELQSDKTLSHAAESNTRDSNLTSRSSNIKRKGKIVLTMEDDVRTAKLSGRTNVQSGDNQQRRPTPNIFFEDGDPEFDDLDEEDPDDDLDI